MTAMDLPTDLLVGDHPWRAMTALQREIVVRMARRQTAPTWRRGWIISSGGWIP
jgi:hypothetical protein